MSGIYIPDVKFPPKPWSNILIVVLNGDKQTANFTLAENLERVEVPFVSVPDHGRLVDADALERNLIKMQQVQSNLVGRGIRKSRAVLRDLPTIIPASEE